MSKLIDLVEAIAFEAVGLTALSLAHSSAGELTLPQWRALVVLGRVDNMPVGAIAKAIGMSLPSTSRLLRRLERRGVLNTTRSLLDRRVVLVSLTPKGRRLRGRVIKARKDMIGEALGNGAMATSREVEESLAAVIKALQAFR